MNAAAPMRFLSAAFWPLSVWTSLTHLDEHGADDYVERTFPIIATAVGFWICALALAAMTIAGGASLAIFDGDGGVETLRRTTPAAAQALWLILPTLYVIGFWLFTAREERYRS